MRRCPSHATNLLFAGALCVALFSTRPATAQTAPHKPMPFKPATPSNQPSSKFQQAKALSKQAGVHYRAADFKQAAALYKKALKLVEHPSLIFNLAQCQKQLGNYKLALFHYEHYLAIWAKQHPGVPAPNATGVYKTMTKIKLEQQAKAARAAAASQRSKPQTVIVKPKIVIGGGQKRVKHALLRVDGVDIKGARVLVDGSLKAVAPVTKLLEVVPGKHRTCVEAKGYVRWCANVETTRGEESFVRVKLRRRPERSTGWLLLTIGTLVAAAGMEAMAIYFTVQANDHIKDTKPFNDDKRMVTIGHAVAGGLAALSALPLTLYLLSDRVEEPSLLAGAAVVPQPGGVAAVGMFRF